MSQKKISCPVRTLTLEEILLISEGRLLSQSKALVISGVATPDKATEEELIFFKDIKFAAAVQKSKAALCITTEKLAEYIPKEMVAVISDNPYKAYALVAQALYYNKNNNNFIASSAVISSSAILGKNCVIKDNVVLGENVILGEGVTISANSVIGNDVEIGSHSIIGSNVTIEHAKIGQRVIIHSGARLGQDGFGFASDSKGHYKIPQLGQVIIGNDVEIGANSTIDKGALGDTEIGAMTKIDNLVHIAHNVKIGEGCIIVAQVGIAGSTELGKGVVLGGQVGIVGHLKIADNVLVAAKSLVSSDIVESKKYGGIPAVPLRDWHKQVIMLNKSIKRDVYSK